MSRDSDATPDASKSVLRQRVLAARERFDGALRKDADRRIAIHLLEWLQASECTDIAGFHPFRGEPDLGPVLATLARSGRRIWLPVVEQDRGQDRMFFRRWTPETPMARNRFGIPEPVDGELREPAALDLVLTPLVAFTAGGARLGMGAGFYDRAFGFLLDDPAAGPRLVGVAYGLQQVDALPADPWDVPLYGVLTERGLEVVHS